MLRSRKRGRPSGRLPGKNQTAAAQLRGGGEKGEQTMEFTGKQIREARERIAPFVEETPLLRLKGLDAYLGC